MKWLIGNLILDEDELDSPSVGIAVGIAVLIVIGCLVYSCVTGG